MSDLDKTYFEATSVNINEQIDLWNERGKGYYGEYKKHEKARKNELTREKLR